MTLTGCDLVVDRFCYLGGMLDGGAKSTTYQQSKELEVHCFYHHVNIESERGTICNMCMLCYAVWKK